MPFPKIHNCIICDDLRQEAFRKASILGFYGLTPYVQILIKDLGQPIARLTFLFLGDKGGEGTFQLSLRILTAEGSEFLKSPPVPMSLGRGTANIAWNLQTVQFPKVGRYTISLLENDTERYQSTFEILQGREEDFIA